MSQTLVEKIVQRFSVKPEGKVHSGDYITIKPAHVLTHDNTGAVIPKFNEIGKMSIANPRQPVFALDHNVQNRSEKNLEKYKRIEAFASKHGIDFHPAGMGIGHELMCDEGYALPYTLVVASDSHSNMYGGLGCLGTPIVRTDAAGLWVTGQTWWQIPPVSKVNLINRPQHGVSGKDISLALCGLLNKDQVLNHALEFSGDGIQYLSIEERLTIANMSTEWGALVGLFPVDKNTVSWYENRLSEIEKRGLLGSKSDTDGNGHHPRINRDRIDSIKNELLSADADAFYASEITLDLSTIAAVVSGPHHVKTMYFPSRINEKNIKIDKAYLVSCVNGRYSDFKEASLELKNKKIADHVSFYIGAASEEIQKKLEADGIWDVFIKAGATILPPGCGPCIGLGEGLLNDNEIGISATNRNFKGRMGSKNSEVYLGSPVTVARSAVRGYISADDSITPDPVFSYKKNDLPIKSGKNDILFGFPEKITGKLIFCPQDNMNTDGIYPGKYTYVDNITPEEQAKVVMENYDSEFINIAGSGDILAGAYNFGTGSSREQAATAFMYKGIQAVIAGSFSETYKRNAINNGFIVIDCPGLCDDLKIAYDLNMLTVDTQETIKIDFITASITFKNNNYPFTALGKAAQTYIVARGLINAIKNS